MKRFTSILLALAIALSFSVNVFAADDPAYLYDGIEYYSSAVVSLPDGSGSFSYSFASGETQYSDFVISPQEANTSMYITITGTSEEHDITFQVFKKDSTLIFSDTLTVLEGERQEFIVPFYDLEVGRGYYIKLTSAAKQDVSGTVSVRGRF